VNGKDGKAWRRKGMRNSTAATGRSLDLHYEQAYACVRLRVYWYAWCLHRVDSNDATQQPESSSMEPSARSKNHRSLSLSSPRTSPAYKNRRPKVSIAMGAKTYWSSMLAYFSSARSGKLRCSTCLAGGPGEVVCYYNYCYYYHYRPHCPSGARWSGCVRSWTVSFPPEGRQSKPSSNAAFQSAEARTSHGCLPPART